MFGKAGPVDSRQPVVLGQQVFADLNGFRSVIMLVLMVMVGLFGPFDTAAIDTHGQSTSSSLIRNSSPCSRSSPRAPQASQAKL